MRAWLALSDEDRAKLAAQASYTGSAEHKTARWWGGLPKAKQLSGGRLGRRGKQDTTPCPLTTAADRERANDWLRRAILAGQYVFQEGDQQFPKKVWFKEDGQCWMGSCVNTVAGEYKGWPITDGEYRAFFG